MRTETRHWFGSAEAFRWEDACRCSTPGHGQCKFAGRDWGEGIEIERRVTGQEVMNDNDIERGKKLARAVFAVGDMPHDRVQRIEFRGGQYPDRETSLGGLCESALAGVLARALALLGTDA